MKNKKNYIILCACIFVVISAVLIVRNNRNEYKKKVEEPFMNEAIKITLTIKNLNYEATLENNATTQELLKRLPLTITMQELNGNEKYYYFNNSFSSSPKKGNAIHAGDIMLYGNDCLVLFYKDFETGYSYTKIGSLDNPINLEETLGKGNIEVTITK